MTVGPISQSGVFPGGEQRQDGRGNAPLPADKDPSLLLDRALQSGDLVRVTEGPFAGVQGVIGDRCADGRVVIALDLLQRGVSLEIAEGSTARVKADI